MEKAVEQSLSEAPIMKSEPVLSQLSETLIGSEIVRMNGEIKEKMKSGEKIFNFTIGDFDPALFAIPLELEEEIIYAYRKHYHKLSCR